MDYYTIRELDLDDGILDISLTSNVFGSAFITVIALSQYSK